MTRILFIAELPPIPTLGGNMQRTHLISRALGTFGSRDLLVMQRPDVYAPDHEELLRDEHGLIASVPLTPHGQRGLWKRIRPIHPATVDRLAHVLKQRSTLYSPDTAVHSVLQSVLARGRYDLIVGRYLRGTSWSGALGHPPVILDLDDLDTQVVRRQIELAPRLSPVRAIARWHLKQLNEVLPRLLAKTEHVWVSNPADIPEVPHQHVSVLPNIPFPKAGKPNAPLPPRPESKVILSVGGMGKSVLPSFHRFIFEVWPKIRRAVPDARFRIVGTGIDDHLKKMWRSVPGVEPIGFVEDLISEYDTCAFTLVPFRGGGGTKIKVLESLSYGRTCLMYRHINRGLESILRDREAVWLVDDETEIVRDCIHLLTHPDLTVSLGTRGALQVAASYSYNSFEAVVHKTLAATLDRIGRAN